MVDLSTTYLGLNLKHPVVPSASPLSDRLDKIRRLEDAGAAAVVMYSLFEEQIVGESHLLDHYLSHGTDSFAEALNYFPEMDSYNVGPHGYLDLISRAKAAVDIPIIGSLNGFSTGGWVEYARMIQEAGADALELNTYYIATDPDIPGAEVEQMYLDVVRDVKANIQIPLAVKVGPFFSSFANVAMKMAREGADGLVIFNRFYQPDFDLERLEVVPNLVPQQQLGDAPALAVGVDPLRSGAGGLRHHPRRAHLRRCAQGHHGRGEGDHDGVGAAAQRRPAD